MPASSYAPIDLGAIAAGQGGFVIHGEDLFDLAGIALASAGDVNGDGFDDILVGAPGADGAGNAESGAGAAYVIYGRAGGFGPAIDLGAPPLPPGQGGFVIQGDEAGDDAGRAVASAGDVNGDGFADLIIGAPGADGAGNAEASSGAAYLVFGGPAGGFGPAIDLGTGPALVLHGEDRADSAGFAVSAAGDVNGDGIDDLVIGAFGDNGPGETKPNAGAAYVVFGRDAADWGTGPIDLAAVAAGEGGFLIQGEDARDLAASSVAAAGDVNGDGFGDLVIGARAADGPANGLPYGGAAYVVFGHAGGPGAAVDLGQVAAGQGGFVIQGEVAYDYAGFSVAGAGDVNGDGIDDLVIGTPGADGVVGTMSRAGAAYVVFGRADGAFGASVDLADIAAGQGGFVLRGLATGDDLGRSVAGAGDVNGDGFDDLILGARLADGATAAEIDAGAAYVVFGRADGFAAGIDLYSVAAGQGGFAILGEDIRDFAGFAVSAAGDVNGDGFDDLLVGAYQADGPTNAEASAGAAYVIFGGGFQGGPAGSAAAESLRGTASDEYIQGLAGADTIAGGAGDDSLSGGDGNDRLGGGRGADVLSGGRGADLFAFGAADLGLVDRVLDFDRAEGDRIVLRPVDAIAATPVDDAFTVIGTAAFSGLAGELRWEDRGRGVQRIEGDLDGDGVADLVIDVVDAAPIEAGWFVL